MPLTVSAMTMVSVAYFKPLRVKRNSFYIFFLIFRVNKGKSCQHCLPSVHFVAALLHLSVFPFGVGGLMWI